MSEHARALLPARTEHATLDLPTREKLIVMVAVLLGLFLSALDQTIVGVALPRIVSDLRGSDLYTWVVTAYLLTSTITVPSSNTAEAKPAEACSRKGPMVFLQARSKAWK